jgi:hypothetical protein
MELLTNRDGHTAADSVLFSADGRILMNPFPSGWKPVNWTGSGAHELIAGDGKSIGRFNGHVIEPAEGPPPNEGAGNCGMTADLAGDFRDEVVCTGASRAGTVSVSVYTNINPVNRREVTRPASREYRLWMARNLGGGYGSYFEWQP